LFATVISGIVFRKLDASVGASGPHDFAVRISAARQAALLASTASRPASVTIASAPLRDETAGDILLIWVKREAEYFCKSDWTGKSVICPSGKSEGTM
jgi:hypothetical protein